MIDTIKANLIYRAMQELTEQFDGWQAIGAIRETVGGSVTRAEFDTIIAEMMILGIVDLAPEDNQKTINGPDAYNAVAHPTGVVWHLAKLA